MEQRSQRGWRGAAATMAWAALAWGATLASGQQPANQAAPASHDAGAPAPAPEDQAPAPPAEASGDPRIDPGTGAARVTYPPDTPFDHRHMRLEIEFPDFRTPQLIATQRLGMVARGSARRELVLDCDGPVVSDVLTIVGEGDPQDAAFEQVGGKLRIALPTPVEPGQQLVVTLSYSLDLARTRNGRGEGLTYRPASEQGEGGARFPQVYSQGEAQLNSRWFPCHDHPNDRLTTELIVTVEAGLEVVSNGKLLGTHEASADVSGRARTTWHWAQGKPHANYLVCLFIGKVSKLELGGDQSARPGLDMPLYVPVGDEESALAIYADTPRMISFFEGYFDEPYPWEKYAQVAVPGFVGGGMENTSATFNTSRSVRGSASRWSKLIAHEAAHQWMGNLVTCKSWEHIWINEGWATFAEALWAEHQGRIEGGEGKARERYLEVVSSWMTSQRRRNKGTLPRDPAMASNRFDDPDKVFTKRDDPYDKGALVLHMLRERMGGEALQRAVRTFIDRFALREVETDDFRRACEDASGQSLERFFEQWVQRPGIPRVAVDLEWQDDGSRVRVGLEQTQPIDRLNPAYALELPVQFELPDGEQRWETLAFDSRGAEFFVALPARPARVRVDPRMTVLVDHTIRTPISAEGPRPMLPTDEPGRDEPRYPPHRAADITHMDLDVTIPDMGTPLARVVQKLDLAPIARPLSSWRLDAPGLRIDSVECNVARASFAHDGQELRITFAPAIPAGVGARLTTRYAIDHPAMGMIWTTPTNGHPGLAPQIHTQGQPETNRYWFPTHDAPNEKMTTSMTLDVPEGFTAMSNGARRTLEAPAGRARFAFGLDAPHAPYLVSLVVGRFDEVDVRDGGIAMPVLAPPGRGEDARATYRRTPEMLRFFEEYLDEPYPWGVYAQSVVREFSHGGMENTGATTMAEGILGDAGARLDHDFEGIISHELAHQWFGDLLTCRSWEHTWLNEGFATYMTGLWIEGSTPSAGDDAGDRGHEAYLLQAMRWMESVASRDTTPEPEGFALACKEYPHPSQVFGKPANPYGKGASVLHMLRRVLGDDAFHRGLREYVQEHRFSHVETGDLRRALERTGGVSLEQFFAQWAYRAGVPELRVELSFDEPAGRLDVRVTQRQPIDGDNPAFTLDLPMLARCGDQDVELTVRVAAREQRQSFPLPGAPSLVAVDPMASVLARWDIDAPDAWWLAQARAGPTLVARVRALRALGSRRDAESLALLGEVAADAGAPVALRAEAIDSLAKRSAGDALRALGEPLDPRWGVREALAKALGNVELDDAGWAQWRRTALEGLFEGDESLKVRCAALRSLAKAHDPGAFDRACAALRTDSHAEALRLAGLDALEALGTREGISAARALCDLAYSNRVRARACEVIGSLAHHDPGPALDVLSQMGADPSIRVRRAAGVGLARVGTDVAASLLRNLEEGAGDPESAWRFGESRRGLEATLRAAGIADAP